MNGFVHNSFHAAGGLVYHSNPECVEGARVTTEDRVPGPGELPLCDECLGRSQTATRQRHMEARTFRRHQRGRRHPPEQGKP